MKDTDLSEEFEKIAKEKGWTSEQVKIAYEVVYNQLLEDFQAAMYSLGDVKEI